MKDERKTKRQLIEELEEQRRRAADSVEAAVAQKHQAALQQALRRIQEETLQMREADDIDEVLAVTKECMEQLGIPFQGCSINTIAESPEGLPGATYHMMTREGGFIKSTGQSARRMIAESHRSGEPAYRRDLDAEDVYGERQWLPDEYGPVRSILDVPFSHGTLAVNSLEPNAFSGRDVADLGALAEAISLAYTRYLDFGKLEEQNRKLEVEQILERVRGQALGMLQSEDLTAVAATIFGELRALDLAVWRCGFGIYNDQCEPPELASWFTTAEGDAVRAVVTGVARATPRGPTGEAVVRLPLLPPRIPAGDRIGATS